MIMRFLKLFLLVAMVQWPLYAETSDHPIKTFFQDGGYLVTSPLRMTREDIPLVVGVSASIGGVALLDRTIRRHLFPWRNTDPSEDLRHFGDYGQVAGPVIGTFFGIEGFLADNPKSKETAYLTYETFLWAGALEVGIKYIVGRERPSVTDDPFHFNPGKGNSSFPSGHATEVFAAATVFAEQYPEWYVILPAYGAAGAVGFSRLYANQHWVSDVVAGAILGTAVSHALRARHRHQKDYSWQIETNGMNIKLVHRF